MPAKAGIHKHGLAIMDAGFRRHDNEGQVISVTIKAFYAAIAARIASSRSATMLVILIIGFTAGPAVSL